MISEDQEDAEPLVVVAPPEAAGERLDRWLAEVCPEFSRTRLKQLMLEGAVMTASGAACSDPSQKVKEGAVYSILVPEPEDDTPVPENIPLTIVYEDDDLLVIDKAAGMVVHPAPGNRNGTLVNALLYHCGDSLSGIGGVKRPGIVHRLDKETSGLMMVAKNDAAHRGLSAQLADRTLSRRYLAIAWGNLAHKKGHVEQPIGRHPVQRLKMAVTPRAGRDAVTHYERLELYGPTANAVECRLETGRTHQVRVHMAHLGHPLVGDPVYGLQRNAAQALLKKGAYGAEDAAAILAFPRQALHARRISFVHPGTNSSLSFEAAVPRDMDDLIRHLKSIT